MRISDCSSDVCSSDLAGIEVSSFPPAQRFLGDFDARRPGCLLLDIRMPGMSGLELQAELNRRGVVLPVVMITAHAAVPVAIRAMREGAYRSEERRVGKECVSTCRYRGSPYN